MKKLASLLIVVLISFSCKKKDKALSIPVEFTSTTYQPLGTYNSDGTPDYLINPPDVVSSDMQTFINSILIEHSDLRPRHPELLATSAIADIKITQASDVFITFVSQVTNATNALGFYTYNTATPPASAKDIVTITYVLPSAGLNTKLHAGDKVKIGRFSPGTSIGFVIMKNAWIAATATLDNKVVHFCSDDVLNPEVDPNLKKHAVLINYAPESKVLIGFENTDRTTTSDNDFNDIVIYATVTP
jgi:hypothetical protein